MGPVGFSSMTKNKTLHDLESKIIWQNAKGLERVNIPSAADRYSKYQGIEALPKEKGCTGLFSPSKIVLQDEDFDFPESLNIDFGNFKNDLNFLKLICKRT